MLRLETGNRKIGGFTLIELLVVLVILAIVTSIAILSLNSLNDKRRLKVYLEYFSEKIKLLQQEATLKYETLGLKITRNHIQKLTLRKNEKNKELSWIQIPLTMKIPSKVTFCLVAPNIKNEHKKNNIIIFYPDSKITPFILKLSNDSKDTIYFRVHQNGQSQIEDSINVTKK